MNPIDQYARMIDPEAFEPKHHTMRAPFEARRNIARDIANAIAESVREQCAEEVHDCGECDCPELSRKAIRAFKSEQGKQT